MNMEGIASTWTHNVMLAAASETNAPATGSGIAGGLPLNGFDFLLIVTLIVGFVVGKKRGMSGELLDLFEWLLIIVVCPLYYQDLGKFLSFKSGLPLMYAYMLCFAGIAMAIKMLFTTFKVKAGEKVVGSDLFGGAEYYLGMLSGMIRFFCMLLLALALMNAIPFSEAEVKAEIARRDKLNDGSNFLPPFGVVQIGIFKNSLTGPFIRKHMADQLIVPTNPNAKAGDPTAPPSRKERKAGITNAAPASTNATPKK